MPSFTYQSTYNAKRKENEIRDFAQLIKRGEYVDRSLFIREIIENRHQDSKVFIYPSRSGKSVNLSMLRYFFSVEVNGIKTAPLFEELQISKNQEAMQHQGRYTIIYLDFKDLNGNDEKLYEKFYQKISNLFSQYQYIYNELNQWDKKEFDKIINGKANHALMECSLKKLARYISEHNEKIKSIPCNPIVLIDHYDELVPQTSDKLSFIRGFFGRLKDSDDVIKNSILTGSKYPGITTNLLPNHCVYYEDSIENEFSSYFGNVSAQATKIIMQEIPESDSGSENKKGIGIQNNQ